MPRKKKVENKVSESAVTYTGNVTIEKVRANKIVSKKVIKNAGCLPLFKFMAQCLTIATAENAEAIGLFNSKPQYLNCFYNEISSEAMSIKSYMKQVNVVVEDSGNESLAVQGDAYCAVNIKFLLQDNNFKTRDSKINRLALYSLNNVESVDGLPHAYIEIPDADALDYTEGVNYIITWTLKLANK